MYCNNNPVMYSDGDGTFPQWVKYLIGGAFILGGLAATVATGGAFLPALAATAKAVAISTAISAGIGAVAGGISSQSWKGAFDGLLEGAANGFMWGGIFAGTAQLVSAGFKIAANMGAATGRKGGIQLFKNIKVLSPNNSSFYENGGTLIKFGKNLRLDVGSKTLLHAHAFGFNHIPIGTSLASLIGGLDAILSL